MHLIDSHCHLNFEGLSNRLPEVLANMEEQSVKQALAISVSKQSFAEVFDIAQANEQIYCTIGVHPDSQEAEEFTVAEMVEAAKHPKVVGIGETGLDYYWCKGDLAWQHRRFAEHIQAANESGLPVIVHTRDAAADTLAILKEGQTNSGVIHCFTEDTAFAKAALDFTFPSPVLLLSKMPRKFRKPPNTSLRIECWLKPMPRFSPLFPNAANPMNLPMSATPPSL